MSVIVTIDKTGAGSATPRDVCFERIEATMALQRARAALGMTVNPQEIGLTWPTHGDMRSPIVKDLLTSAHCLFINVHIKLAHARDMPRRMADRVDRLVVHAISDEVHLQKVHKRFLLQARAGLKVCDLSTAMARGDFNVDFANDSKLVPKTEDVVELPEKTNDGVSLSRQCTTMLTWDALFGDTTVGRCNLLVVGKAGSGKSTLIRQLLLTRPKTCKRVIVLAPSVDSFLGGGLLDKLNYALPGVEMRSAEDDGWHYMEDIDLLVYDDYQMTQTFDQHIQKALLQNRTGVIMATQHAVRLPPFVRLNMTHILEFTRPANFEFSCGKPGCCQLTYKAPPSAVLSREVMATEQQRVDNARRAVQEHLTLTRPQSATALECKQHLFWNLPDNSRRDSAQVPCDCSGLEIVVRGPPGCGKTAFVKRLLKTRPAHMKHIALFSDKPEEYADVDNVTEVDNILRAECRLSFQMGREECAVIDCGVLPPCFDELNAKPYPGTIIRVLCEAPEYDNFGEDFYRQMPPPLAHTKHYVVYNATIAVMSNRGNSYIFARHQH